MLKPGNVLISLEAKHAENILSGKKHVELRRRTMAIPIGTIVWFYVKKPLGAVVGYATVVGCYTFAPSTLWRKFSTVSGLTRQEFFEYFQDAPRGFALALGEAERLSISVSLESLRANESGFHPPQFFMRLFPDSFVLKTLQEEVKNKI